MNISKASQHSWYQLRSAEVPHTQTHTQYKLWGGRRRRRRRGLCCTWRGCPENRCHHGATDPRHVDLTQTGMQDVELSQPTWRETERGGGEGRGVRGDWLICTQFPGSNRISATEAIVKATVSTATAYSQSAYFDMNGSTQSSSIEQCNTSWGTITHTQLCVCILPPSLPPSSIIIIDLTTPIFTVTTPTFQEVGALPHLLQRGQH